MMGTREPSSESEDGPALAAAIAVSMIDCDTPQRRFLQALILIGWNRPTRLALHAARRPLTEGSLLHHLHGPTVHRNHQCQAGVHFSGSHLKPSNLLRFGRGG